MKKWVLATMACIMGLAVLAMAGCATGKAGDFTLEDSRSIAEEYLKSSPTFVFDGMEDTIKLVGDWTMRCPYCWAFEFEFQCSHAGYGDRTGQVVAQVITRHTASIAVHRGEVVQAVMDGVWDMMEQEMVAVDGDAVAETLEVEAGSSFTLSLDSNPTTGYGWTAHFDGQLLELVDTRFEPSSDLIGAGGVETFEFRAVQGGDTAVTLVYERTWEEGYLQKVVYRVHITGAAS